LRIMFYNFLRISLRSLLHRKVRSMFAILGVIISISVVIALLFLGQGLRDAVSSQLKQFGSDLIFVFPGDVANPFTALLGGGKFKERHLKAVEDVEGVEFAMPTVESRLVIGEYRGEKKTVSLHAQPWREIKKIYEESQGYRLASGVWPEKEHGREIVLGRELAAKLFVQPLRVADEIVLRGRRFQVAGVLQKIGEQNHDNSIFVSLAALEQITGEKGNFNAMIIKKASGYDTAVVVSALEKAIVREKGIDDFSVLPAEKAGEIAGQVISLIQLALTAIALIAVIVGTVGVMNTMFTSVLERRREIGIMKAVGATPRKIIIIFLTEAALLGTSGGMIGALLGGILAKTIEWYARGQGFTAMSVSINFGTVAGVIILTVAIGMVAGVVPARRAAALNPVEALRFR